MQGSKELLFEFSKLLKEEYIDASVVASRIAILVGKGLQLDSLYDGNTTAIHLASEFANQELVKVLLRYPEARSAILDGDANDKDTAIHMAAIGGSPQIIKALLEAAPSTPSIIDTPNRWQQTPLHYAMGRGRVEAADFLIKKGANVGARDHKGSTPLHFAARSGVVECLQLLETDASKIKAVNEQGLNALHFAAWNGKAEAVDWLLKRGVDLRVVDRVKGRLALHLAAETGSFEVVNKLLKAHHKEGVGLFEENYEQKNVLQVMEGKHGHLILPLLRTIDSLGLLERTLPSMSLVRYVIAYGDKTLHAKLVNCFAYVNRKWRGAIISLFRDQSPQDKLTILEWAAIGGTALVSPVKLAKEYLSPQELETQLKSALQLSLLHKNWRFANSLVEHCDDKLASWIKDMKKHFINEVVEANLKEQFGEEVDLKELSLAYLLFFLGRHDIVRFIKKHKSWEGIVNDKGHSQTRRTALHWATIFGQKKIVSQLCAIPECRANLPDKYGKPAYQYAMENGRLDIQRELSERGDVRSHLDILYRDRQVFVDASNAILVGATLIATITFSGLLQPPLGFTYEPRYRVSNSSSSSNTMYVHIEKPGIQIFWFFNSLSFFFAMATTLAAARGVLPKPDMYVQEVVKSIRKTLLLASFLLAISITSALLAFSAAGFTVLPPDNWWYQANMLGTVIMGSLVCMPVLVWFIKGIYSLQFKRSNFFIAISRSSLGSPSNVDNDEVLHSPAIEEKHDNARLTTRTRSVIKYEHEEYPWKDGLDE